jgi:hypothetical protein
MTDQKDLLPEWGVLTSCECGHTLQWHRFIPGLGRTECQFEDCTCKKYRNGR